MRQINHAFLLVLGAIDGSQSFFKIITGLTTTSFFLTSHVLNINHVWCLMAGTIFTAFLTGQVKDREGITVIMPALFQYIHHLGGFVLGTKERLTTSTARYIEHRTQTTAEMTTFLMNDINHAIGSVCLAEPAYFFIWKIIHRYLRTMFVLTFFVNNVARTFYFTFFTIRRKFIIGHTITGIRYSTSTYIFIKTPVFFMSIASFSMPEPISILRNIIAIIQRTIHFLKYITHTKISFQYWNIFYLFLPTVFKEIVCL